MRPRRRAKEGHDQSADLSCAFVRARNIPAVSNTGETFKQTDTASMNISGANTRCGNDTRDESLEAMQV